MHHVELYTQFRGKIYKTDLQEELNEHTCEKEASNCQRKLAIRVA